jgi:uncharacterized membrane protein YphA (DoxX/SURF4 family)
MQKYDHLVPLVLRLGMAAVFAWFGLHQLFDPSSWIAYVPGFLNNGWLELESIILLNGWAEVVGALLLLIGFQTRPVALLLGLHMLFIAIETGGAIGVRDLGITIACLALALSTVDRWSVDAKLSN